MRPDFPYGTVPHHHDPARTPDRRQPVRHHEGGAPAHQAGQYLLDEHLRLRVQRGRRLVEDQYARMADEAPRAGEALALTAWRPCPVFAHQQGVEPARQPVHELQCVGVPQRRAHGRLVGVRVVHAVRDVPPHGSVEQDRLLSTPAARPTRNAGMGAGPGRAYRPRRAAPGRPDAGRMKPITRLSAVDFPAPGAPTSAIVSRGATERASAFSLRLDHLPPSRPLATRLPPGQVTARFPT